MSSEDVKTMLRRFQNHKLYKKDESFQIMVCEADEFFQQIKYSRVCNKSLATREKENQDSAFYETILVLLQQVLDLEDQSERNVKTNIRMLFKWFKENKGVLHRNMSEIQGAKSENGKKSVKSILRVSEDVLKRAAYGVGAGIGDADFDTKVTEQEGAKESDRDGGGRTATDDDGLDDFNASLLDMPDQADLDVSIGTVNTADLTQTFKDENEVLIPGASKPFILSMPIATPLEQPPLKNMKSLSARDFSMSFLNQRDKGTSGRNVINIEPGEIWEQFLQSQKAQEEFATMAEFYGRHGTAYTKRYSSHARSWGPESSTREVIDNYANMQNSMTKLPPETKDRIIHQNLEDFQEFENDWADKRRIAKSAASSRRPELTPLSSRKTVSSQIRSGGKVHSLKSGRREKKTLKFSESQLENVRVDCSSSNGVKPTSKLLPDDLVQIVDESCKELVMNKEQIGPEPSRGFRQPFQPINPFKTMASQTITLTTNRAQTAVTLDSSILLIPGISTSSKRKDPQEFKQQHDPMTPRTLPGQMQCLKSAGGSTARGNRPYTTMAAISSKDKWANHQPSDENIRVKGAANHPFYSFNRNVLEKFVMVNHLGSRKSQPWWKGLYQVSSSDLEQYLKDSYVSHSSQSKRAPQCVKEGDLEIPAVTYVPNIASKKSIVTWS